MKLYPYPHQVLGQSIIGKPAKQAIQSIKGLGAAAANTATAAARAANHARWLANAATRQAATAARQAHQVNRMSGLGIVPRINYHPVTRNVYNYGSGGYGYGGGYNYSLPLDLLLLQEAQSQPGYGAVPYGSSPYQNWNYNPYYNPGTVPYNGSAPYPQYQYETYQQCVGSGGDWDSFANACTGQNTSFNPYSYEATPYGYGGYGAPQTGFASMPSVVGMAYATGVSTLNSAGFNVWLLSNNGIPQGTPPGYVPNRAVITVNNNIITSVYQG